VLYAPTHLIILDYILIKSEKEYDLWSSSCAVFYEYLAYAK
jgi:hypothetical protein